MKKILILFAHPALEKSRVNRQLINGLDTIDSITFHDLYQAYPDFDIDVSYEQQLAEEHDLIIFHHPFYWYSTPALIKEWLDLVLQHGWAFGSTGNALRGKYVMQVITAGGREQSYSGEGYNKFSMRELLAPMEQSFNLCKMNYLPPFIVHGTHAIKDEEITEHKSELDKFLDALMNDSIDLDAVKSLDRINADLNQIIAATAGGN